MSRRSLLRLLFLQALEHHLAPLPHPQACLRTTIQPADTVAREEALLLRADVTALSTAKWGGQVLTRPERRGEDEMDPQRQRRRPSAAAETRGTPSGSSRDERDPRQQRQQAGAPEAAAKVG